MKIFGISLILISSIFCLFFWIGGGIYAVYSYNVQISQYVKLSDDASTAELKLQYLTKYSEQIKSNITRNSARYIFVQDRLTKEKQLQIIDSLILRLKQAVQMNPLSFEYQQAMAQISGEEYSHTLDEIDNIISGCWLRQSFWGFGLFFGWWICLILLIIGIGICTSIDW